MAIPGQYHYPNSPDPTTPPPAGGGTTPPAGGGGGAGGDWFARLFGTANIPDWLKQLLQRQQAGRPSYGLLGGQAAQGDGTGWWGSADDLAKIKAMMPASLPNLRAPRPAYHVPGTGWTTGPPGESTFPAPVGASTLPWETDPNYWQKILEQGKGVNTIDPQPASQGGGSSYFGGSAASSAPASAPASSGFGGSSGLGWLQSFLGR